MQQRCFSHKYTQRGAALLILVLILSVAALSFVLNRLNLSAQTARRDQITDAALAQAKDALIGYAAGITFSGGAERPGDLPCPDKHPPGDPLEGTPSAPCNTNTVGRLPWKKLGLPDLRDSSGERLWYAVSDNFRNSPRTTCTLPGQPGCLNSDTSGSITVRSSDGTIVNDGTGTTGAIAVIIAPGNVLTREDGVIQVRDAANANNPVNYLDIGIGEDNTTFGNGSTDGFINGVVRGAGNVILVNDRVLAVTYENLMPLLEKRVTSEVANCLKDYAADPLNQGRLPWAADIVASAGGVYSDSSGTRFGRLPSTFINTVASSGVSPMKNGWTASCNVNLGSWWPNWSELVFYALADAYKPRPIPPLPACGLCLTVSPPSAMADKRFAVFLAGRRLPGIPGGQPRSTVANKGAVANYLENENATPADDIFSAGPSGSTFNDRVLFQ